MQIIVEPVVLSNMMLYATILAVTFGYFSYRIRAKKMDRKTRERQVDQYARVFKENSSMVNSCVSTLLNLVTRVEQDVSAYCRYKFFGTLYDSFCGKICRPLLKYFCSNRSPAKSETDSFSTYCANGVCQSPFSYCPAPVCPIGSPYTERNPKARPSSFGYCPDCPFGSAPCPLYADHEDVTFGSSDYCTPIRSSRANECGDVSGFNCTFDGSARPRNTTTSCFPTATDNKSYLSTLCDTVMNNLPTIMGLAKLFTPNPASSPLTPATKVRFSNNTNTPSDFETTFAELNKEINGWANIKSCEPNTIPTNARDSTTPQTCTTKTKCDSVDSTNKFADFNRAINDLMGQMLSKAQNDPNVFSRLSRLTNDVGSCTERLVDFVREYDEPQSTEKVSFDGMTTSRALDEVSRLQKDLCITNFMLLDCIDKPENLPIKPPNQKFADLCRLLYYISAGPKKFEETFSQTKSSNTDCCVVDVNTEKKENSDSESSSESQSDKDVNTNDVIVENKSS